MKKEKYSMLLGEVHRYKEVWIIYKTDGNYIDDCICTLPAGSKVQEDEACKVLETMNN